MKKVLQGFLVLFGATVLLIAALHLVLGPAVIPGSVPVNATMDSEDRFFATLFAAYGIALLSCVRGIERRTQRLHFLAAVFFAGGLARLISMALAGLPHPFFIAMTGLELGIPVFMVLAQRRICGRG